MNAHRQVVQSISCVPSWRTGVHDTTPRGLRASWGFCCAFSGLLQGDTTSGFGSPTLPMAWYQGVSPYISDWTTLTR